MNSKMIQQDLENPLQSLQEKIVSIIQDKDFKIEKEKNQRILSKAIKNLAEKGFLRTHAFIHNWLKEFLEEGELSDKYLLDIRSSIPWSWDQTKKYFDALESSGILVYSRDSTGKKTCTLTIKEHFGENRKIIPDQELRLFHSLKYQKNVPTNDLVCLKSKMRCYYSKLKNFKHTRLRIEKEKEKLHSSEKKHIKLLAEEIATFYWYNRTRKGVIDGIKKILEEKPTSIFSLEYKK